MRSYKKARNDILDTRPKENCVCRYCRQPLNRITATLEHIKVRRQAGRGKKEYLDIACWQCNHERGRINGFTSVFKAIKKKCLGKRVDKQKYMKLYEDNFIKLMLWENDFWFRIYDTCLAQFDPIQDNIIFDMLGEY